MRIRFTWPSSSVKLTGSNPAQLSRQMAAVSRNRRRPLGTPIQARLSQTAPPRQATESAVQSSAKGVAGSTERGANSTAANGV